MFLAKNDKPSSLDCIHIWAHLCDIYVRHDRQRRCWRRLNTKRYGLLQCVMQHMLRAPRQALQPVIQ